jgi:hypothetical protein
MRSLIPAASAVALAGSVLAVAPAQATPACTDPVAKALHTAHDTTGDPGGLAHETEETWCGTKP